MRIGAVFSQADSGTDPEAIRQWAIDAESAGFDHLLAYDHVLGASVDRLGPGPFGSFPSAPYTSEHTFHEILVMFSHLAAVTTRMHFVTSVLVLPQRQTALVAKQIASIDLLSGGRIRVAVGVGWNAAEYEGLGVDFADRTALLEEQIDVMRMLWTQPLVDFDGRFHRLHGVGINPPPTRPIPILIGSGASDAVLRRVVRKADGWMPLLIPGLDPIDIGTRSDEVAPLRRGSRARPVVAAHPWPGLHRSRLAGRGRAGAGARIQRLQHRLQPARPTRVVTRRASPGRDCGQARDRRTRQVTP